MKHLKLWENYSDVTTSRKKGEFLYVILDDVEYMAWMWNPTAIKKEIKERLISENSWLIEVEESNGTSKTFECQDCLDISPYYNGDEYLNNKQVREILIDKVKEYHNN